MNPPDAGYECVAYEFREEWDAGASEWRGVCEKWRVGPVFASETNGVARNDVISQVAP